MWFTEDHKVLRLVIRLRKKSSNRRKFGHILNFQEQEGLRKLWMTVDEEDPEAEIESGSTRISKYQD